MAVPTIQEIRQLAKTRNDRKSVISSLRQAKTHSEDIRLHTEVEVDETTANPSYGRFLHRVKGYLIKDKFDVFKKYHRFPMATTATCSSILSQLKKVFEGKDAIRAATYTNERLEADFNRYLKESKFHEKWRNDSFRALSSGVNSILVVDMPEDSSDPYFYFLSIEEVHDLDVDSSGKIKWLQFWSGENTLTHITQDGWQVWRTSGRDSGEVESLVREATNETGMDIAWFWWEENMKAGDHVLKKSPFSEFITKLDWLEVWATWKRMLDAFASNPVMWTIQEDCDFRDAKKGVFCDGGYLKRNDNGQFVRGGSSFVDHGHQKCPKCSDKRFVAPGSVMEIPPPDKESDFRAPFGIVDIPKDALENCRVEQKELIEELVKGITGGGQEPMNQEAINVTQVSALFEGWTGVLRNIKKSFESSEARLLEVVAALKYGGRVLDMFVNYGSEFYLMSEQGALVFYTAARDMQLPDYVLDFLFSEYLSTKFRFDRKGMERAKILMAIEPFKHLTKSKVAEMAGTVPIDNTTMYLKLNFGSLVQQFETDNGNVADFGANLETGRNGSGFSQRVNRIREVLVSYIPETAPAVNE